MPDPAAVRAACRRIRAEIEADARYAHTGHLRVLLGGESVFDEHYRGPAVTDVFSPGLLPGLDEPLHEVLPALRGTPSRGQTWRHLLTMTRGAAVDGPWDVDEVTALPGGQVARVASAPVTDPPGRVFRYDNGATHLLSAGLSAVLGRPVAEHAAAELFGPLGIRDAAWLADPDGVTYGFAHLPAGGWASQHVVVLPGAVVVTTGDPGFDPGPPPRDELPPDWRPALDLVRRHLLPVLLDRPAA
jgi:hypothetical protein